MLSYEEFKEVFNEKFPEYMGDEYADYEIRMKRIVKRGIEHDGFIFIDKNKENDSVMCTPTLYYDEIYDSYKVDENLERELTEISICMERAIDQQDDIKELCSLDHMKENIIAELVSTSAVRDYISQYPHRDFLDMTIIYRWVLCIDSTGVYSGMIDYELMKAADLTESELYEAALSNTDKLLKFKLVSFEKVVRKIMRRDGIDSDEINRFLSKKQLENQILTITNDLHFRGSTALIYDKFLKKIGDKLKDDFYIIPSSCNESLAIPASSVLSPEHMLNMLHDTNVTCFNERDEILSWNIYYYSRKKKKLEIYEATSEE